jgi:hypothetical protein
VCVELEKKQIISGKANCCLRTLPYASDSPSPYFLGWVGREEWWNFLINWDLCKVSGRKESSNLKPIPKCLYFGTN